MTRPISGWGFALSALLALCGCAGTETHSKTPEQLICEGQATLRDIERHPPKEGIEFAAEGAQAEIDRGRQLEQQNAETQTANNNARADAITCRTNPSPQP